MVKIKPALIQSILFTATFIFVSSGWAQIANESRTTAPSATMGGTAQAANSAASSQKGAQSASLMMAAMMATQCGPQNPMACVMAAMALAQGASLGGTSKGATDVAQQSSTTGAAADPARNGTAGGYTQMTDVKNQLIAKGVKVGADMKSVQLPDGKSVALTASAATDAGMKSNGFSDAQISAAKAALADAQGKLQGEMSKSKKGEIAMPGGGGGGGSAASYGGGSTVYKLAGPRKAAKVSGLSKI
jgi:hypothetical protein